MKPALLRGLVLVVVATGAVKWARHLPHSREASVSTVPAAAPTVATACVPSVETTPPTESATATGVPGPFRWGEVETTDYRRYLANLRVIGCPEPTIADIIAADVHALYDARRKAGSASTGAADAQTASPREPREFLSSDRPLWRQEERVVRALLTSPPEWWQTLLSAASASANVSRGSALAGNTGHDPVQPGPTVWRAEDSSGGPTFHAEGIRMDPATLPGILQSKAGAITDWHRRTTEATRNLEARRDKLGPSPELLTEQAQLEAAFAAEFDQLLTPAEREEFVFHFSPVAQDLRNRLQHVALEEPELRALVGIRQELDRVMAGVEISGDAFLSVLHRSEAEMAQTLGPDKWREVSVRGDVEVRAGPGDVDNVDPVHSSEPGLP